MHVHVVHKRTHIAYTFPFSLFIVYLLVPLQCSIANFILVKKLKLSKILTQSFGFLLGRFKNQN
jgi:hypothetical protein